MHKTWNKTLKKLSGNLTTNEYMPQKIRDLLLDEDAELSSKFTLKEIGFPKLSDEMEKITGLDILAGLQKLEKKDCLTVFRAIRFPTNKRMFQSIYQKGFAMPNYEQDRILELYNNPGYINKRKEIQKDHNFWILPQERVVKGLPVFNLVNDAIQIHHAFRHKIDKVLVIVIYLPASLLKSKKIRLVSNSAIDLDFKNADRDYKITEYISNKSRIHIDLEALSARGIDLHEMYIQNLPWNIDDSLKHGIEQDYFLLDIYEFKRHEAIKKLFKNTKTLKNHKYFLHGFFGDQSVFARPASKYLPCRCHKVEKIK